MCGFLFIKQTNQMTVSHSDVRDALKLISWRGPDASGLLVLDDGKVILGHNRLAIVDLSVDANQPMYSKCGRYLIVFNGEIYNHLDIRKDLKLICSGTSDTETIIEGFSKIGINIIQKLDGMFALVVYDVKEKIWYSARDRFGIKPLFIYENNGLEILASEPNPIATLISAKLDNDSKLEWELLRRPIPGRSYYQDIAEHLPATWRDSSGRQNVYWILSRKTDIFDQSEFEELLIDSIYRHKLSDVDVVSLLSGGLDSSIITVMGNIDVSYTVGLTDNNEVLAAEETALLHKIHLVAKTIDIDELVNVWVSLTKLRGEPLSVPNEALIYLICKEMAVNEKVVLTGEGADELLFGYDSIFRWAIMSKEDDILSFINRYGYCPNGVLTDRMRNYLESEKHNKTAIEFTEDFFYKFHLPGLLRRMDFASMAASKEARVPFVDLKLVEYCYRVQSAVKISDRDSKIPLRNLAGRLNLDSVLKRKKIGFSASTSKDLDRYSEYTYFRNIVSGAMAW